MFDLAGKTALVTGAASGIGRAIALRLARAGAFVYAADRDGEGAQQAAAELISAGGQGESVGLDITDVAAIAQVRAAVEARWTSLSILVNNAGIGHVGTILSTSADDLERLWRVNVLGTFQMCQAFLPAMINRGAGVVINIASIGGVVGLRDRLAYCTSKYAIVGLTKCLALDHALQGIRVTAICPGRVETPFVKARLAEYPDPEKAYREMTGSQAVNRMGTPEEIAAAAHYLASDEAAFVTGSEFIIDGGFSAGK
jgi:NAD(P)-dependent dehydrogenase (short-subunit alcohol dehydrogenase family)